MKRKLLLAALCVVGCALGMRAQTDVPFLKEKADFGGTAVSSLTTFVPSGTTYTIQVTGTAGDKITVAGAKFEYTPTADGTVRFVRNGGNVVYVYEGTTYKGTVDVSEPDAPTYPTSLTSASTENIIVNGGFEANTDLYSGQSDRWKPTPWNSYNSNKSATGNGTSVRSGSELTGSKNMLMHGDGYYLTQQLASGVMKSFTPYQISYEYVANSDGQKGSKYRFQVGSSEFASDYFNSDETPATTTTKETFSTTFVTPAVINQPYVQISANRAGFTTQRLDRFDEFILVAATGGGIGITGATDATCLLGSAYAPVGGFASATTDYSLASTYATSLVTNGTFDSNTNGWTTTTGASNKGVASNKTGAFTGNYWENWNGSAYTGKMYQSVSDIPNGTYKLNICAFVNTVDANKGQYVYANDNKTYVYTTTPTAYTVYTYVANNTLEYGLNQVNNDVNNWMGIDNVSLEYCGADNVVTDGYASIYNAMTGYLNDDNYSNVTGSERTTLQNVIAANNNPEATADGYATATFNIGYNAVVTFTAAKSAYDTFDVEKDNALVIGVKENDIVRPTSASNLQDALYALYVQEDVATTSGYPMDGTDIFGTWTTQNAGTTSGQHWSDDAGRTYFDKWNGSGFSMGVTNNVTLPAGKYVFKIAGRAATNSINGAFNMSVQIGTNAPVYKDFVAKGDVGKGIDTSGAVNYGEGTFAYNGEGRGWEWRFIGFELEAETAVVLKAYSQILGGNWVGFSDPTLLTTSNNVGIAKNVWEKAKTAAEAARDNTDYAKVDGAEKKALTDAIGAEVTETIEWYQTQTETLKTATTNFTATETVTAYNRWDAAKTEATTISYTHSYAVENTTTATEALTYANSLYTGMFNDKKAEKAQGDKVLGFQTGEYAPYNNTEVIAALAAADAITDVAATETATLDAAINGLNDASDWVANTEDVDAIYNGLFATVAEGQNYPEGWKRTNGWGQMQSGLTGDYATAYYNQPGSLQYGNQGVYTMPLAANTWYKLTFAYRSHQNNSNNKVTVSVLNGEDGLAAKVFPKNASTSDWKVVSQHFKTGAAGDYVLTLANDGNTWMTGVSLVKEVPPTITKTAEPEFDGYKTFYNNTEVNYKAPEGAKVYIAAEPNNGSVQLTEVGDNIVPADKAVILKTTIENNANTDITLTPTMEESTADFTENKLQAAADNTVSNVYILACTNELSYGFYYFTGTLDAGDVYLTGDAPAAGAPVRMVIVADGEATAINSVKAEAGKATDAIYNMAGQRVDASYKGIVIKNGKKYMIK